MLECIVHQPKKAVSGTVIWLHGLGASGDDFVPVRPHLNLPHFRFVFPQFLSHEQAPHFEKTETINNLL